MADPSSEEDGVLREWAPLTGLLQQIPLKAQRGLFTHDLNLTCVDSLPEFIAVGTNLGLVYWYSRKKGDLQRLRCENTASAITCVKVISTVDFMVAAGNDQGIVTVFQIPKIPPDNLPESMKPKKNKQVERYTISGLHTAPVTAIEWSMNGMKLFSGDKNGLVVLTEIDFYMHLSKSAELLNEKYEIVQLSYSQQLLLVSTLYRSIVCCHREDRWKVAQVGQKERKSLGRLGATFCLGSGRPQELIVYASRPGLRVWLADKNGVVQQTLIYKDALMSEHTNTPLINPAPAHVRQSRGDHQFGPLLVFRENLLVTYSSDMVYVLNPASITVVATVADVRKVQDVSVNKDEIFILEGERSLIRVAYTPESTATFMPDTNLHYASSTDALVNIMSSPQIQSMLANKSVAKRTVWRQVSTNMHMLNFPMGENGAERCKQKWNNIVRNYHHYARTRKFDVKAHRPLYYDKLEELFDQQKQILSETSVSAVDLTFTDVHGTVRGCKRKSDFFEGSTDSKVPFLIKRGHLNNTGNVSSSELSSSSDSSDIDTYSKHCISENITYSSLTEQSNYEELVVVYPDAKPDDKLDNEEVTLFYTSDLGNYTVVDHTSTEEGTAMDVIPSSAYMLPENSAPKNEVSKSLTDFLKKSEPFTTKKNKKSPIIISPKPNQPARPIPTAGEAMMSLILRLHEEQMRKERGRMKRKEARLDKLENILREQNTRRQELLDAALLVLESIKNNDA